MDLPICDICAKTGVLCNACEEKLQKEKISELDVEFSRALYGLGKDDVGFERAIDSKNCIIVVTRKEHVGRMIGRGGENIRTLSDKLGKQLKIIGKGDLEATINDLVAPARMIGINTVYKKDGSTFKRVRIKCKDRKKLRMSLKEIEKVIASLTDDTIELSFED